jgi:hypothetical protein
LWIDDVNITRGGEISLTEMKQRITHFAKSEKNVVLFSNAHAWSNTIHRVPAVLSDRLFDYP